MDHATVLAAATQASASSRVEAAAIFAVFLACLALFLARAWRKARRERAAHEAWRVAELASARRSLAAAETARRKFRVRIGSGTPDRYGDRYLLDQHRQDISVYRANVRDLENW